MRNEASNDISCTTTAMSVPVRILIAFIIGVAIAGVALIVPSLLSTDKDAWWPPSFLTHTLMLLISFLTMVVMSGGRLSGYGFTRGSFHLSATILLWIIPTSILSVLQYVAIRSGATTSDLFHLSRVQTIIFIWVYASLCEEVFVRGLLQGYLSLSGTHKVVLIRRWPLSAPVLFCGLFFGAMHVVLWTKMGPLAIVPMILATGLGVVTGYYREKTGSLIPGVLIHGLFNIGGSLPLWILLAWTN